MKTKTLIGVLGILLPMLNATSQKINTNQDAVIYSPLDNIPMPHVLNWTSNSMHLYDIRYKLIILDFWNTRCSVCISHFRQIDSLQREYADRVQFIMVTSQSKQEVSEFLQRWQANNGLHLSMPFVVGDTAIRSRLSYLYQPAYAWIGANYHLLAKTAASFISRPILESVLSERLVRKNFLPLSPTN